MKVGRFTTRLAYLMLAVVFMSIGSWRALAQSAHSHAEPQKQTQDQARKAGALLKIVRDSTERFQDVNEAEAEGYALQFGCVSGDSGGAMGLHYVNGDLVNGGVIELGNRKSSSTRRRPPEACS